jgi:predicted ATPase
VRRWEQNGVAFGAVGRLIGRQAAEQQLQDLIEAATRGHGGLVLVAGEAGAGKTRLVSEVLREADLTILRVSSGAATSGAYGPIVGALRAFLRHEPARLLVEDRLSRYLPLLLPELSSGSGPVEVDRATLYEVMLAALRAVASSRPAVVFLDDLQDADHATLDVLPYLADSLSRVPLLVIGTYRSDEPRRAHSLRRLRADLRRAGHLHEVLLEPLDRAETAALAADLLGQPIAPALADLLYERTDGLPLFIEELVMALRIGGRLEQAGESWRLADAARSVPVPETVRDLVLLRATPLSPATRLARSRSSSRSATAAAGRRAEQARSGLIAEGATDSGPEVC